MKRFIIACCCIFALSAGIAVAYFSGAFYVSAATGGEPVAKATQVGKSIYLDQGSGPEEFEIRGVDMGVGIPGHFATDYAIDKETYLRWFGQIKEMGANTIRVYILQGEAFYEAFYEYNEGNPDPLYLLHGVWIDDYAQNSHMDAFDGEYLGRFKEDIRTTVDVIHGQRPLELGRLSGTGSYTWDISPWVIGYLLGVEWEAPTVMYTDMAAAERASFNGQYVSTTADATPFEAALAEAADEAFRYETDRYGEQRLVALSNWPTTDPLEYPEAIKTFYGKYASVDVEHLRLSDKVVSGTFASYHVYPYYPDYLRNIPEYYTERDPQGNVNTYYTYLAQLVEHHSVPVVIAEFGVSSARGMAQVDANTNRNQGYMSEQDQGRAIAQCYQNIMDAGCAGSIIFTWQDEWFKRTWNTMENVDLLKAPYWSDYQTNEQSFGLLSFDPGEERCVSYVDGDDEEWGEADVVGEDAGRTISMKYDERFVYLMVRGSGVSERSTLYLPIDTTQKTGSLTCDDPAVSFDRAADFLVVLDGRDDSRVLVQERYEVLRAMHLRDTTGEDAYVDPPAVDTPVFKPIGLVLQTLTDYTQLEQAVEGQTDVSSEGYQYLTYETGKLTYGDANPAHEDFNSLADFCFGDGFVEIKLPWQLLNFSNPSEMQIHDDYYECYGVENMAIDRMWVGVGTSARTIPLFEKELEGWGSRVTYHERLKESYYLVQDMWTARDPLAAAASIVGEGLSAAEVEIGGARGGEAGAAAAGEAGAATGEAGADGAEVLSDEAAPDEAAPGEAGADAPSTSQVEAGVR